MKISQLRFASLLGPNQGLIVRLRLARVSGISTAPACYFEWSYRQHKIKTQNRRFEMKFRFHNTIHEFRLFLLFSIPSALPLINCYAKFSSEMRSSPD